jgi:hypothetical protein
MSGTKTHSQRSRLQTWRKWLLAILVLFAISLSSLSSVDGFAEAELENVFQRALVTFALARTLNGVISVVQGTELALQPAGVGVTLTPGEILDPINDLVERFSWIMLGATVSLGIQQVLLDIGQWWITRVLVAVLGLVWLWVGLFYTGDGKDNPTGFRRTTLQMFIIILFVRFAVPLTLIANEALYRVFLEPRYLASTAVIEQAGAEIQEVGTRPIVEESEPDAGLMATLERALHDTRESLDIRQRMEQIKSRAADLIEHLIQLCVVFILQTGILPIAFLWVFLQLLKSLYRGNGRRFDG